MKKLTDAQYHVIAIIEQSIPKLTKLELEANSQQMPILANELKTMQRCLRDALSCQLRAFRDDSLIDKEPLFPEGRFPYGKKG